MNCFGYSCIMTADSGEEMLSEFGLISLIVLQKSHVFSNICHWFWHILLQGYPVGTYIMAWTYLNRGLSREKIETVFGHFTKFNIRKTDSSQNSLLEKQTFYSVHYQNNRPFKKFSIRKTDSSQNSIWEKQTFQYQKKNV